MVNYYIKFILLFLVSIGIYHTTNAQYNAIILKKKTNVSVENNKCISLNTIEIQINDKASNWLANIEIPFEEDEKIKIIKAQILDKFGNVIREIKKKEIITKNDVSAASLYEDSYVKAFKLHHNNYPYRIKYSYIIEQADFLFIAHWSPIDYYKIPTKEASLNVQIPKSLAYKLYCDRLNYKTDSTQNQYHLSWDFENVIFNDFEIYSPSIATLAPRVIIIPTEFTYGIRGKFDSWESYGQWQLETNNGLDELPQSEKNIIDKLLLGVDNTAEKIKILYKYLQKNTRYINVVMGIGGLKPHPAKYVAQNKYGDCKALTNYMQSMLKYAGIKSHYVKIYAGNKPKKLIRNLPSPQFNHVILCVPTKNDTLWVENTSSYFPAGYLGTFTQNRYALLVKDSASKLVKTPALGMEDVKEEHLLKLNFLNAKEGQLTYSGSLRGKYYEHFLGLKHTADEEKTKKDISNFLPINNTEVLRWEIIVPDRDKAELKLNSALKFTNHLRVVGNDFIIPVTEIGIPDFEKPKSRKFDVHINYPVNDHYHFVYDIPHLNNFTFKADKNIEISSQYGYYNHIIYEENNMIHIEKSFQLNSDNYSLDEYPDFFNFMQNIKEAEKNCTIFLKHK